VTAYGHAERKDVMDTFPAFNNGHPDIAVKEDES